MRLAILLSSTLLLSPLPSLGQALPGPGSLVRIHYTCAVTGDAGGSCEPGRGGAIEQEILGTVSANSADSLAVLPTHSDRVFILPLAAISRLEISVARHGHALGGMGIGALLGASGGAVAGFASGDDSANQFISYSAGDKALVGGIVFGVLGGVAGAAVGALAKSERWQVLPLKRL